MRVYSVQHKESEWAIPVAAETSQRAKVVAWKSNWRLEFTEECLETNPYYCLRVRWQQGLDADGPERVIPDGEAFAMGFWGDVDMDCVCGYGCPPGQGCCA